MFSVGSQNIHGVFTEIQSLSREYDGNHGSHIRFTFDIKCAAMGFDELFGQG
jgi:hypothetical protein